MDLPLGESSSTKLFPGPLSPKYISRYMYLRIYTAVSISRELSDNWIGGVGLNVGGKSGEGRKFVFDVEG
jgi:hypothetical protein